MWALGWGLVCGAWPCAPLKAGPTGEQVRAWVPAPRLGCSGRAQDRGIGCRYWNGRSLGPVGEAVHHVTFLLKSVVLQAEWVSLS